ncbi:hypothetical protein HDV00_006253 [Rhizophlyctis rosea]|nr:hypothetical protein HDV00_006253 [Rhizophlyctis rosea]
MTICTFDGPDRPPVFVSPAHNLTIAIAERVSAVAFAERHDLLNEAFMGLQIQKHGVSWQDHDIVLRLRVIGTFHRPVVYDITELNIPGLTRGKGHKHLREPKNIEEDCYKGKTELDDSACDVTWDIEFNLSGNYDYKDVGGPIDFAGHCHKNTTACVANATGIIPYYYSSGATSIPYIFKLARVLDASELVAADSRLPASPTSDDPPQYAPYQVSDELRLQWAEEDRRAELKRQEWEKKVQQLRETTLKVLNSHTLVTIAPHANYD